MVARYIRIVEVSGSNPLCSTKHEKSELSAGRRRVRIFFVFMDGISIVGQNAGQSSKGTTAFLFSTPQLHHGLPYLNIEDTLQIF